MHLFRVIKYLTSALKGWKLLWLIILRYWLNISNISISIFLLTTLLFLLISGLSMGQCDCCKNVWNALYFAFQIFWKVKLTAEEMIEAGFHCKELQEWIDSTIKHLNYRIVQCIFFSRKNRSLPLKFKFQIFLEKEYALKDSVIYMVSFSG